MNSSRPPWRLIPDEPLPPTLSFNGQMNPSRPQYSHVTIFLRSTTLFTIKDGEKLIQHWRSGNESQLYSVSTGHTQSVTIRTCALRSLVLCHVRMTDYLCSKNGDETITKRNYLSHAALCVQRKEVVHWYTSVMMPSYVMHLGHAIRQGWRSCSHHTQTQYKSTMP